MYGIRYSQYKRFTIMQAFILEEKQLNTWGEIKGLKSKQRQTISGEAEPQYITYKSYQGQICTATPKYKYGPIQ